MHNAYFPIRSVFHFVPVYYNTKFSSIPSPVYKHTDFQRRYRQPFKEYIKIKVHEGLFYCV